MQLHEHADPQPTGKCSCKVGGQNSWTNSCHDEEADKIIEPNKKAHLPNANTEGKQSNGKSETNCQITNAPTG